MNHRFTLCAVLASVMVHGAASAERPKSPDDVYTVYDADVNPPVARTQRIPPWTPDRAEASTSFHGTLEVIVDETGAVASAKIRENVHPAYNQLLLRAAREWKFTPAHRLGTPVRYLKVVEINLTPPPSTNPPETTPAAAGAGAVQSQAAAATGPEANASGAQSGPPAGGGGSATPPTATGARGGSASPAPAGASGTPTPAASGRGSSGPAPASGTKNGPTASTSATPTGSSPAAVAPGAPVAAATVASPSGYVIGTDDVLTVVFWRDKEMSGDVTVRPDGNISLPLLNDVMAAGRTPEELRTALVAAAGRYVEDPNATVVVKQINSRKVFVTGNVMKPGPYPLTTSTSVLQVIATAGGLKEYADEKNIVVIRTENGRQSSYRVNYRDVVRQRNLKQNIQLKSGDTVVVP